MAGRSSEDSEISRNHGKNTKGMRTSFILFSILSLNILCLCWTPRTYAGWAATGPNDDNIPCLAIDPKMPTTLYAGTDGGGVYKSTNGGASWTAVSSASDSGMTSTTIVSLAIDPEMPTTLYAGTNNGVFRSTNGGMLSAPEYRPLFEARF